MTQAELIQLLSWRLGDRDDMEERILAEMPYVQDYVLEAKPWCPWFLLTEEAHASTTVGERRLPLPEDFLMEAEESHLYLELSDGSTTPLRKLDFDVAAAKLPGSGLPLAYSVSGNRYELFPIPDGVYTVYMTYYGKDSRLTDTATESQWMKYAGDVVAAELGKAIAEKHLRDMQGAQAFAAEAAEAWTRLYHKHIARGEVNISRALGGA